MMIIEIYNLTLYLFFLLIVDSVYYLNGSKLNVSSISHKNAAIKSILF